MPTRLLKTFCLLCLVLGGVVLVGSAAYKGWYFSGGLQAVERREAQALARQLEGMVANAQTDLEKLQALLKRDEKAAFPDFLPLSRYPTYIFRDTAVAYWSDDELVPSYAELPAKLGWQLTERREGTFLLYQDTLRTPVTNASLRVVALVPLKRHYPVRNYYLNDGWLIEGLSEVNLTANPMAGPDAQCLHSPTGQRIACLLPAETPELVASRLNRVLVVTLGIGAALLAAALVFGFAWGLRLRRYRTTLWLWITGLVMIRAGLLLLGYPREFASGAIVDSRIYASSDLAPSLADLLLNLFTVAAILFGVFRLLFQAGLHLWLWPPTRKRTMGLAAGLTLAVAGLAWGLYAIINNLYQHTPVVPTLANGLRLPPEKWVSLGIVLLAGFSLFFATHPLLRMLVRLHRHHARQAWLGVGLGLTLITGMALLVGAPWLTLAGMAILLIAAVALQLPEFLYRLRYQTYFYLFGFAILAALAASDAYLRYEQHHTAQIKAKWSRRLVQQGDPFGEYLLAEMQTNLGRDTALAYLLARPNADLALAERQIRNRYTDNYFDQYHLDIGIYNTTGQLVSGQADAPTLLKLKQRVSKGMALTSYPGLHYSHMPSEEVFKRYLNLITLTDSLSQPIASLALDLRMSRLPETSVFPTLLVDGPNSPTGNTEPFSFAVYDTAGHLLVQDGRFGYERDFDTTWLNQPNATHQRLNWAHTIFSQTDGQSIVISSPDEGIRQAFAHFSFMLLAMVVFVLLFIVAFTLHQQAGAKGLTFAGKIQIYLNGAFFLPLTVFGLITFLLVDFTLRADLNAGYLQRARTAARSIAPLIDRYTSGALSRPELTNRLDDISRFTGLDASVYNAPGRLLFSSHPLIFRKSILSGLLNPTALSGLADGGQPDLLLEESIGKLEYSSAYVAIRAPGTRQIRAIMAVPFFDSGTKLERQLTSAVSTVMNTFTAVFIVFMALSYFASQILVVPLKLITARLKRTTLTDTEPLRWPGKDEIGLLVQAYNRMLAQLARSRKALMQSEKETAWREMAQQVAHEIKNPLTPMRLKVQQMQRQLAQAESEVDKGRYQKSLESLLEQIDALSDIASSFSSFAKMPVPEAAVFDIARTLRTTTELHTHRPDAIVEVNIPPSMFYVNADEGIFQGIFNNLIINGLQSVTSGRTPYIRVNLTPQNGHSLRITITDNGSGIPEDIQGKVFLPNFSTKFSGSGIGLALAKRGVEHAGGKIWFETEVDAGTTFFIELPVEGENRK